MTLSLLQTIRTISVHVGAYSIILEALRWMDRTTVPARIPCYIVRLIFSSLSDMFYLVILLHLLLFLLLLDIF